jgi:hypothetical protein
MGVSCGLCDLLLSSFYTHLAAKTAADRSAMAPPKLCPVKVTCYGRVWHG